MYSSFPVQTLTALMETCLKTNVSRLASWQLDQHPALLVTDIGSQTVWLEKLCCHRQSVTHYGNGAALEWGCICKYINRSHSNLTNRFQRSKIDWIERFSGTVRHRVSILASSLSLTANKRGVWGCKTSHEMFLKMVNTACDRKHLWKHRELGRVSAEPMKVSSLSEFLCFLLVCSLSQRWHIMDEACLKI